MRSPRSRSTVLVCALLLAGCAHPGGLVHVLRIAVPSDPASLSPLVAFAQTDIANDLLVTQTLLGLDARGRVVPELVTRVPSLENGDISSDGRTITYRLRPGVRFADGVPLTSNDVRFTYRAMLDASNRAADDGPYRRIARLATPDAHTVVIRLRSRWNAAVHELFAQSDFAIGILPAHAFASTHVVGTSWDDRAFGTGPFRVAEWRRGDRLVLERNPYFTPQSRLERLEIRFIPTFASALAALRGGDVDVAELGPDEAVELRGISGFAARSDPLNGNDALTFQSATPPTNDVRVRRALADAIDYATLRKLDHGLHPPLTSLFGPSVVTWRAGPLSPPFARDPARAARELEAAGWRLVEGARTNHGKRLELVMVVGAADATQARTAVVVQRDLAALGVTLAIKSYPQSMISASDGPLRNGRFSLAFSSLVGGSDPEPSINLLCAQARPGGQNYGRYCSHALDAAFADQSVTPNRATRAADFARIERLVRDELPMIPLHQYATFWGVADRVSAAYARNPLDFPLHPERWDAR